MTGERAQALLADRDSSDKDAAYQALRELFKMADEPVDWAYEVWDRLLDDLTHREGHKRAFAAQMLTRLAISDPNGRMLKDLPKVAAVMRDEKTVTARHTLQSIWRVGLAGPEQRAMVMDALEQRFRECADEKNGTLVRTDAITALARLFIATDAETIEARAHALIDAEPDEKQARKQRAAWRKALRSS
jgi:hypothetical protein